jgi:hypothetical protein
MVRICQHLPVAMTRRYVCSGKGVFVCQLVRGSVRVISVDRNTWVILMETMVVADERVFIRTVSNLIL